MTEPTSAIAVPEAQASPRPLGTRPLGRLVWILLAGGAVSLALGVYANEHDPTLGAPYTLFFTTTLQLKVWFATTAVALAVVQILLALRIYGKVHIPRTALAWLGDAHRLIGVLAFTLTLPVAYQCLWGLGFQSATTRVLVHSLLGCFFYGAFTVKVLAVRVHGLPNWTLPVVGGLLFTALVGIWLTSSVWFFTSRPAGIPLF